MRAIQWWCGGVILFGAVLAGAPSPWTDAPAMLLLRLFGGHPPAVTAELRFAVGLMGAVTLGWGASLLAVARTSALLAPDQRLILWQRVSWAVAAWCVIDSAISVGTGFWPNAVSNAVLLAWYGWAVRRG